VTGCALHNDNQTNCTAAGCTYTSTSATTGTCTTPVVPPPDTSCPTLTSQGAAVCNARIDCVFNVTCLAKTGCAAN